MRLTVIVTPLLDKALRLHDEAEAAHRDFLAAYKAWHRVPQEQQRMVREHPILATGPAVARKAKLDAANVLVRHLRDQLSNLRGKMNNHECRVFRLGLYQMGHGAEPTCPICNAALNHATLTCPQGCDDPITY